jgi:hypothetical protein
MMTTEDIAVWREERERMTREFITGATRDSDDGKLKYKGFLSPVVLRKFAEYMHRCRLKNIPQGQELRAPDNWKKGIPMDAYADSLIRHVMEAWEQQEHGGLIEDDTLTAIMFNAMGYLHEKCKLTPVSQNVQNARYGQLQGTSPIIGAGSAMMQNGPLQSK